MIAAVSSNLTPKYNVKIKKQVSMTGLTTNMLKMDVPPESEKTLLEVAEDFSKFVGKMTDKVLGKERILDEHGRLIAINKSRKGILSKETIYNPESGKLKKKIFHNEYKFEENYNEETGTIKNALVYYKSNIVRRQDVFQEDGRFIRTMNSEEGKTFLITAHRKDGSIIKNN